MRRQHQRKRQATRLGLEMLEPRTLLTALWSAPADSLIESKSEERLATEDMIGAVVVDGPLSETPNSAESVAPKVELSLELTSSDGTPLTTLAAGQTFVLHVYAQDRRDLPHGVFAAYLDVLWNSALARVAGPIRYSAHFANGKSGTATTPGQLDKAGAFSTSLSPTGGGKFEVFNVTMRALAAGTLKLQADAIERLSSAHDTLVFGENDFVRPVAIVYGSTALIIEPGAAEIPADDLPISDPGTAGAGHSLPSGYSSPNRFVPLAINDAGVGLPLQLPALEDGAAGMFPLSETPVYGGNGAIDPANIHYGTVQAAVAAGEMSEADNLPNESAPGNSAVRVGEEFELRSLLIFVGSLSPTAFAGITDLTLDGELLAAQQGSSSLGRQLGQPRAGQLDETGRLIGDSGSILVRKNFVATASGEVEFAADPADDLGNASSIVSQNEKLPPNKMAFGRVRLNVHP